jgi:hypothetical protein
MIIVIIKAARTEYKFIFLIFKESHSTTINSCQLLD